MSYGSENYTTSSSSYRKNSGDSPRYASSLSRTARSSSRTGGSRSSLYRGTDSDNRKYGRPISICMPLEPSYDLIQRGTLNNEFKIVRTNEKVQLQGLNDRFATFIEKVHKLEQSNKVLVIELTNIHQQQTGPSRLVELHEQEVRVLRSQLDKLNREKSQHVVDWDRMQDKLREYEEKYEEEFRAREYAEFTLAESRKDVDDATVERMNLEKTVESLQVEINFLRKEHEEEVAVLMVSIENIKVSVKTMEVSKLDLTSALKEIRAQYESMASNNLQSTVEVYENKIAELSEQLAWKTDEVRTSREGMNDSTRQLQSKTTEIANLKGTYKSLEKQLHEEEDRHNLEIGKYQDRMEELEKDMRTDKSDMTRYVREYHDLLNVKLALDIEIAAYRKLLEGEETRTLTGITYSGSSMSASAGQGYNYQSRMYTSSSKGSKRECNVEDQQENISGGTVIIGFREEREVNGVMEREVIDAREKEQDPSDIPTNQNN